MRYFPPKGTAGLERSWVIGCRRSPLPPARTMARTRRVGAGSRTLLVAIGIFSSVVLVVERRRLALGRRLAVRRRSRTVRGGLAVGLAPAQLERGAVDGPRVAGRSVQRRVVEDQDLALLLDARRDLRELVAGHAGGHPHGKIGHPVMTDQGRGGYHLYVVFLKGDDLALPLRPRVEVALGGHLHRERRSGLDLLALHVQDEVRD